MAKANEIVRVMLEDDVSENIPEFMTSDTGKALLALLAGWGLLELFWKLSENKRFELVEKYRLVAKGYVKLEEFRAWVKQLLLTKIW
jgi:hypothetical protein